MARTRPRSLFQTARRLRLCLILLALQLLNICYRSFQGVHRVLHLSSSQSTQRVEIIYQSQAHWFTTVIQPIVDQLYQVPVSWETQGSSTHVIVVESVPSFQSLDAQPCRHTEEPWIQVVGEPRKNYNDDAWCRHSKPPMLRLDTVIQNDSATYTIWVPYVCNYIIPNKLKLRARNFQDFYKRPHLLAWISSNCVDTRVNMWRALKREAHIRHLDGLHSLGGCERDTSLGSDAGWWSNDMIYSKYKFVLAMENSNELGYVSEKIATALAAGAIPIYLGDDLAARYIFNESSFVSLSDIWIRLGIASKPEDMTTSEWDRTARVLIDLMTNSAQINDLLVEDSLSIHSHISPPYDELLPSTCIAYNNKGIQRLNDLRKLLLS